ncbi:MAG: hypothetical protein ACR2NM_01355 [Bythopirellula sp.]
MTEQDQSQFDYHQPTTSSSVPFVLGSLVVITAAYIGFVRPTQEHMQSLEQQCNKLVLAVKKLQTKDDTARHGLRLIHLLDQQTEKLAGAERALTRLTRLRDEMIAEANDISEATAALQQLVKVRDEINESSAALTDAATTLSEMATISASITASGEVAREANGSLATLSNQQLDLATSIAKLGHQVMSLESQLQLRIKHLPQAQQSLDQIDELCDQLADESTSIAAAQGQLSELAAIKNEVIDQSDNVPAASAALDQIWDLKDGLLQAKGTLDKAQQLAVDMMLLEPVLDRVANSLQPAADATRISRREAAKAPKTRQTADANSASPWSSAINVFVALLGSAN